MSYGFKFFNNNNETVIDDTGTKPWYFGQAQVNFIIDITNVYTDLNRVDSEGNLFTTFPAGDAPGVTKWNVYAVTFAVPISYDCFVAFSLPNTTRPVYYAFEKNYALVGDPSVRMLVFVPNTIVAQISDIPKAYIFVANPVPTANLSTGFGMHVFNASQQCTYDSNKRHFQPTDLPLIFVTDPTNYVYSEPGVIPLNENVAVTFPASAAVILPYVEVVNVIVDQDYNAYSVHYQAIHRRAGSALYTGVPRVYTKDNNTNYTQSGFFNRGATGVQPCIILDAAPLDQGYTPPEFPASYSLSITRTNLTEGFSGTPELFPNSVAIVTLTTAGVANGTLVPYTISGISSSDINNQSLTGNFVVSGNSATVTINATSDGLLEGTETATLTLNNGRAAIVFTISDLQSFGLSTSRANPEEGQSILVYLTTQNVPNGTQVPYNITGIQQADLTVGSLSGNFTVAASGAAGSAQFQLSFARDTVFENETVRVELTNRGTALFIPITDLSFGYNEVLSITPSTIQNNQNTVIQITGGYPNDSFQWIVLPSGTNPVDSFNNRWTSQYQGVATSQVLYLDEYGNYYNQVTGPDFGGVGNWTLWIFSNYTKNFRSANVTVTAVPTFSLTGSNGTKGPLTIAEGQTGFFLVTTTNLPNGSVVYPKLVGPNTATAADIINSAENGLVINNNTGSFTIQFVADQTTESDPEFNPSGQEFFNLVLDYPNGTRRDTYGMVYINDTSVTPATYSVSRSAASVNEGSAVTFTFTTNQGGNFYWTLTGMEFDDIWYVEYWVNYGEGAAWENQGQINSGTIVNGGQVRITFRNDQITEGAQTATFSVRSGSITGTVLSSAAVTINDTSLWPAAGTNSGGEYCIGFDRYQNKHNGSGGTTAQLVEANSPTCGYVPPAAYTLSRSVTSVNEGGKLTITITGNSSAGGMLYWNMSGTGFTVSDIDSIYYDYRDGYGETYQQGILTAGSFEVPISREMRIIIYPKNDLTTEGAETVTFFLRSGSLSGPVLASTTLTINDTSIFPAAGTNSGGEYCVGVDRYQNKHNGSGGTYAVLVQANSPSCGFNTWNESVIIYGDDQYQDYIAPSNGYVWIVIGQGEPNSSFTYAVASNNAPQPTSFPGTASLNSSGYFYNNPLAYTIISTNPSATGDMRLWVRFNYNGNIRSARINIVTNAGTLSGGQYCQGTTLLQNKHNGRGGIYAETVQINSPTCGFVQQYYPYMSRGTFYNYNGDGFRDIWYIFDTKPNSTVNFRIVAGPAYVGTNVNITTDSSGFGSFNIGAGPWVVGTYTINATFPGNDASYPTNRRTLVFNWVVFAGNGGPGMDA